MTNLISIDNKQYDFDTLPQATRDQYQSIKFVDSELARLNALAAVCQTARTGYLKALQESLATVPSFLGGDTIKLG